MSQLEQSLAFEDNLSPTMTLHAILGKDAYGPYTEVTHTLQNGRQIITRVYMSELGQYEELHVLISNKTYNIITLSSVPHDPARVIIRLNS